MILVISQDNPSKETPSRSATIPIIVTIQLPKAAQTKSVGEKDSPFPLLSKGASVNSAFPERTWVAWVLKFPKYELFIVGINSYF
jgi:hypothetical protein